MFREDKLSSRPPQWICPPARHQSLFYPFLKIVILFKICPRHEGGCIKVALSAKEAPGGQTGLGAHFVLPTSRIDLSSCQTSISIQPVFQTTFILKCKPIENTKTDE